MKIVIIDSETIRKDRLMLIFPLINDTSRKIIHIDMDAFFASVEERDNPDLKGKPVIIGSDPRKTGGRGVVSTCNYEARKFGVHSAMSSKEAYERCSQAVFISGNYQKYRKVGMQIREIFKRYTDLVEPMSIDEAYLDVTENKLGIKSALKIAKMIQYDIWQEIKKLKNMGISVIITTHYMEEAAGADKIIVMKKGHIEAEGSPGELKSRFSSDRLILTAADDFILKHTLDSRGIKYKIQSKNFVLEIGSTLEALELLKVCRGRFTDFEVLKGNMDEAYIAIIGRKAHD